VVNFIPTELDFQVGKAHVIRKGKEIVLIACGPILRNVILAADILQARKFSVGIVNFHTLKPFDPAALERLALEYRHIVSIEEHSIYGGLGSAAAEILAGLDVGKEKSILHRLGIQDTFGESGTADELLKKHKLDPEGIAESVILMTGI
jgi:transketolase